MGLKNKIAQIGQEKMLEGAKRLQNYMNNISESLTNLEKALNHNTMQIGGFLQGLDKRISRIEEKLGITEDEPDQEQQNDTTAQ